MLSSPMIRRHDGRGRFSASRDHPVESLAEAVEKAAGWLGMELSSASANSSDA
jgi:hypothetical protein